MRLLRLNAEPCADCEQKRTSQRALREPQPQSYVLKRAKLGSRHGEEFAAEGFSRMPVTIQPSITDADEATHYLPGTMIGGAPTLFRLLINWRVGGVQNGFIVQHVQRSE